MRSGLFGGQQHHPKREFANVLAFVLAGQLVGARRRPNAQRQGRSQLLPPGVQLQQTLLRLRAFGGANPEFVGRAQVVPGTQSVQLGAAGVVGVKVERVGREPAENLGNHGPAGAQGAEQDVF